MDPIECGLLILSQLFDTAADCCDKKAAPAKGVAPPAKDGVKKSPGVKG